VSQVRVVWVTPNAERVISDCARVSNPANQGKDGAKLIRFLVRNRHWSPFEMASMCVEIETSRAIVAQILRHRSFSFQEFSQRYSEADGYEPTSARRQAEKNRQSSIDDLDPVTKAAFARMQIDQWADARRRYEEALRLGVARECARMLLPLNTRTTVYMAGTMRSWLHYVDLRCEASVQLEHRDIAEAIRELLWKECPAICRAMWQDLQDGGRAPGAYP
jgi:thymidylate synthase (FAD)